MRDEIGDLQTVPIEQSPGRRSIRSVEAPLAPSALGGIEPAPRDRLDRVLESCGVGAAALASAREAARANRTDIGAELIALGLVREHDLAQAVADCLGVPHEPMAATDQIVGNPAAGFPQGVPRYVKTCDGALRTKLFLMPMLETLDAAATLLGRHRRLRIAARVTTASDIRARTGERTVAARADAARLGLSANLPHQSARNVLSGGQGMFVGVSGTVFLVVAILQPVAFFLAVHALSALMFFACVALRLAAAFSLLGGRKTPRQPAAPAASEAPPVYSVLVALYREEEVVADLVASLEKLEWPASRLEIKLVCEGDDTATILAAERATAGRPRFEIVVVPPCEPRTKPKALNFALPLARGEFVVLYDAEDAPHPRQLLEAYAAFGTGGERLACLQAPLTVRNGGRSWLAGLYALEYAALFRGFLPWLSRHDLPLPLGGTSNHFRRSALVEAGGWDSHNVTEDADLGMRLCRKGYRIGTIDAPTYEDAPERWTDWRNQRTRWMKGWMITYLVHMRDPVLLLRQLGPVGFAVFQILFFGLIASTVAHPFFLAFAGWALWVLATEGLPDRLLGALLVLDLFNIFAGYLAFILLAALALDKAERRVLPLRCLLLYPYWFLISFAAFRALLQLVSDPHKWEKTPHGPAARRDAGGG